jgi:hypothetical protein
MLGDKINNNYCQNMLKKALEGKLTDKNHSDIWNKGNQSSKDFPGLYYLCFVFIHPLTYLQSLDKMAQRLEKD